MPSLNPDHVWVGLPEIGISLGSSGLFGWRVHNFVSKYPIVKVPDVLAGYGGRALGAVRLFQRARSGRFLTTRGRAIVFRAVRGSAWRIHDAPGWRNWRDAGDLKSPENPCRVRVLLPALIQGGRLPLHINGTTS